MILSRKPNEVRGAFTGELEKYADFSGYSRSDDGIGTMIYYIQSVQWFQKDEERAKRMEKFDYIIADEIHIGGTTQSFKTILETLCHRETRVLFVTGTPTKIIDGYYIPKEARYTFSYEKIRESEHDESIPEHGREFYKQFPIPVFISNILAPNFVVECQEEQERFGFDFRRMFMIQNGMFVYPLQIDRLLDLMVGRNPRMMDPNSFLGRIETFLAREKRMDANLTPDSVQLVFLPWDEDETLVKDIATLLMERMGNHPVLKKYTVISLLGNEKIDTLVNRGKAKNHQDGGKGVICLTGLKGHVGVTYEDCMAVWNWSHIEAGDANVQMICRGMTCSANKPYTFIFDLNPQRVLSICMELSETKTGGILHTMERLTQKRMILIDADVLTPDDPETFLELERRYTNVIQTIIQEDPRKLFDHGSFEVSVDDSRALNIDSSVVVGDKIKVRLSEEKEKLPGMDDKRVPTGEGVESSDEEESDDEPILLLTLEQVKNVILPAMCLLTWSTRTTADEMFRMCEKDSIKYECLQEVLKIHFKSHDPRAILRMLYKYLKNNNTYDNSIELMKCGICHLQTIEDKKNLLIFVRKCLEPEKTAKKERGEVFTPLELIEEMLDKLPKDVWSNPGLRWLDPANGIGNFMICVYYRLMEGLRERIPDEGYRKTWILEKMLYAIELDTMNMEQYKIIMGADTYDLNIVSHDTLDLEFHGKFDVIVGNPPYQSPGNTRSTGNTLWDKFVVRNISMLNDNGYLVQVHPSGWRKPQSKSSTYRGLFELMTVNNTMLYLCIRGIKDGQKTFKCGTRYDYYVLQKKPCESGDNTIVVGEDDVSCDIYMPEWKWLPNYNFKNIKDILHPEFLTNNEIIYSRSAYGADGKYVSKVETDEYKYPLVHSTNKGGVRYMYTNNTSRGHFGISKVIFGESGINNCIIDMDGKYGMTHGAMAIRALDDDDALLLKKFIEGEKFKNILKACMWSGFRIDWMLFQYFKEGFWR